MSSSSKLLKFSGHGCLKHRLILATLSGKAVKIDKIRSEDDNPGLRGINCSENVSIDKELIFDY